jgi:hypothetical protein
LDYQRRGFYRDAQAAFERAAKEDKEFTRAQDKAEIAAANVVIGGGQEYSFDGFETAVVRESTSPVALSSGLDTRLTATTGLGYGLPDRGFDRPADAPPVVRGTGTVVIKGDLDAQ